MARGIRIGNLLRVGVLSLLAPLLGMAGASADPAPGQAPDRALARQILEATGFLENSGGFIVHLGCGDGRLTAALHAGDGFLVQGLLPKDAGPENVRQARKTIQSLGLYGKVSVDIFEGKRLPYADNLVNLVVAEDLGEVAVEEVIRVLAPGGTAYVKQGGTWKKAVLKKKPWPDDIDEWTHYLHDASGNAVAADRQVGPPKHVRWIAAPLWSRSHEFNPSMDALVSGGGRMFYIFDEGMAGLPDLRFPARWALYARDAFSGVLLWKRPVPNWGYRQWNTRGMWSAPLTLNRRIVTDGRRVFVTLGYEAPVTVLDAATGKTLRTIPDTQGTDEIILSDGVLLLCVRQELSVASPPKEKAKRRQNPHEWTIGAPGPARIVAVDATTGSPLWSREPEPVAVLTLAALDGGVCYYGTDGIVSLDLKTGHQQWAAPCRAAKSSRHSVGTLVMHGGVALFAGGEGITAFSAANGEKLWTGPRVQGPGVTHPADLFVADGLVWGGDIAGTNRREQTAVERQGYDLKTGEVRRTVEVPELMSPLHHVRCYRSKATDRYLLLPKRGVEFLDLEGSDHSRNDWLRAMCHYGVLPSGGLLYMTPHHCFCYPGVKMNGFLALAAEEKGEGGRGKAEGDSRLERGPAYGDGGSGSRVQGSGLASLPPPPSPLTPSSDWPTYRCDALRSGHTKTAVPTAIKPLWQTKLGGKIAQPVVVGGNVYVAEVDAHRVSCLDAASGRLRWTFTAGGRVDSPPTFYEGLLLFGSRDGWVYCLSADDGRLSWRFRAAPLDRRIVAFDQVESPWPVPGSVLLLDGVAYVCAGRSSFLDGGVYLYGLKPETGQLLYQTRVEGPRPNVQKDVGRPFDMDGTKSDILVTDGTNIYLYQMAFDKKLHDMTSPRASSLGERKEGRHLVATGGFLDDMWYDRTYWMYADCWPGFYYANAAPKAGQILVFDETTTYGLHVFTERLRLSPAFTPGVAGYELFADDNSNEPILAPDSIDREKGPGFTRTAPAKWSVHIPLRAQAMVLTRDKLFMAGPPDVVPEDDPYAAFEGRLGAELWVVSPGDGRKLAEYKLESLPAVDGLVAAAGRLFLATRDGRVISFGESN